jgi:hypothetical protein
MSLDQQTMSATASAAARTAGSYQAPSPSSNALTTSISARQVDTAPLYLRILTYSLSGARVPRWRQVASQTSA